MKKDTTCGCSSGCCDTGCCCGTSACTCGWGGRARAGLPRPSLFWRPARASWPSPARLA